MVICVLLGIVKIVCVVFGIWWPLLIAGPVARLPEQAIVQPMNWLSQVERTEAVGLCNFEEH